MRIPLTRYGLREILGGSALCAALLVIGCLVFWPLALLAAILWACVLAFFRDPERRTDADPADLLSPADGTVWDVEEVDAPAYLEGRAIRIGVFMSVANVHVNRAPTAGAVRYVVHRPGTFLDARDAEATSKNEHCFLGLELADGRRILVNQVAGWVARRIVCAATVGDVLNRGQRFGMIKFGSRLELYLPTSDQYTVKVSPGKHVRAGQTVLASYAGRGVRRPGAST